MILCIFEYLDPKGKDKKSDGWYNRKSSNIRHPQKIVALNFSWYLILNRRVHTRIFFNFKPFLKTLHQVLSFEVQRFYRTCKVYIIPQKISFTKKTKVGKDSHTSFWGFMCFLHKSSYKLHDLAENIPGILFCIQQVKFIPYKAHLMNCNFPLQWTRILIKENCLHYSFANFRW